MKQAFLQLRRQYEKMGHAKTEEGPTLNLTPLPTPKMCNQIFFAFFQFHLIAFQCVKSSRSKLKRLAHKIFLLLCYAKS